MIKMFGTYVLLKTVIRVFGFGLLGTLLGVMGFYADSWQYWAVLLSACGLVCNEQS